MLLRRRREGRGDGHGHQDHGGEPRGARRGLHCPRVTLQGPRGVALRNQGRRTDPSAMKIGLLVLPALQIIFHLCFSIKDLAKPSLLKSTKYLQNTIIIMFCLDFFSVHCKKRLAIFPSLVVI